MTKGIFITLEGGEGTGKSTQIKLLQQALSASGVDVLVTREPGGTDQAERIRGILVQSDGGSFDPMTEALLLFAARREHLVEKIWPALERGQWVISDRFADSTRAFQGYGMGLDMQVIETLYQQVAGKFQPDLTFIFDIDPETGLKRSLKRLKDNAITEDRYERMGLPFHTRLRNGFLEIAKKFPERCVVIDAAQDVQAVHQQVLKVVEQRFGVAAKEVRHASLFAADEEDQLDAVAQEIDAAAPAEPVEVNPRSNPDFLGHEAVEKALLADYLAGRLPHALILAGPPGIGKATLAFRLARFLLSQTEGQGGGLFGDVAPPTSLYVAPEHPVFRRVAASGHADLVTIEREFDEKKGRLKTEISVDAVRRIHPFLQLTAAEGGWRVVVVDSAEYLNASSQNALLKILEEPPKKTVLILTTSQPGSFLPTIRSRCRMVPMEPLPEKVIGTLLDKMAPGLAMDEKTILCRLAEGSIGRALQFYQDDGVALYRQLLGVAATIPALDMVELHKLAEKLGKYGAEQSYATATQIMTGWCERQARAMARGQMLVDVLPGDATVFQNIGSAYPAGHFLRAWEKISQLVLQTETYNLDKKQAIIGAFLALQKPDYQGLNV